MKLTAELAALRVRAALGRAPQDRLEATVVLESWGVSSDLALAVARPAREASPVSSWRPDREMGGTTELQETLEVVGLLAGIMAATICAGPMISRLGPSADQAWRIALPVTLAAQWTLRRYDRALSASGHRERLSGFRSGGWAAVTVVVALLELILLTRSPVAGAALSLVVLWTGGLLLSRRGWAFAYVGLLVMGALGVNLRLPLVPVVAAESETMIALVVVGVLTSYRSQQMPGSWLNALRSGCVGALLGCMIVSVALPGSAGGVRLLGLAMAPSLLGSVVWFYFMAAFWNLLYPGVGLSRDSGSLVATHRMSRLINLVAVAGYCLIALVVSFAALAIAHGLGIASRDPSLILLDLGTIGLAGVLFAWLDVLGRANTALVVECCTLGAGLVVHSLVRSGFTPYAELAGAVLAVILAEAIAYRLHGEPEWLAARML
jgi:hypothetical protein